AGTHLLDSLRNCDFILRLFVRGRRSGSVRLRMPGTTVFVEEVIDPGTRAFQRAIRRRDIDLQQLELIRGFRTVVNLHPDARLLRNHFALAIIGAPAWAISKLLGASLRADMLHVAEDAIAAFLAAEYRRLHQSLRALESVRQRRPPVDPAEYLLGELIQQAAFRKLSRRGKEGFHGPITPSNGVTWRSRVWLVHVEGCLRRILQFGRELFPLRRE